MHFEKFNALWAYSVGSSIKVLSKFQEYTEEIEKLKKDLLAARGKDGFFIAEENYMYASSISFDC